MTQKVFQAFVDFAQGVDVKAGGAPAADVGSCMRLLKSFSAAPDGAEPPDSVRYVKESIRRFVQGAGRTTLDRAFEVQKPSGTRSAARTLMEAEYAQALLGAWEALPGRKLQGETEFPWAEVERFLAEIDEFKKSPWPQWQKSGLGRRASKMQTHLYLACELVMKIRSDSEIKKNKLHPTTVKGMRELLTRAASLT